MGDKLRTETQRLESLYQQKLAALDELKKSLLTSGVQWGAVTRVCRRSDPPSVIPANAGNPARCHRSALQTLRVGLKLDSAFAGCR